MISTQVGRNERCPCGSGKKFKHCCLMRQSNRFSNFDGFQPRPKPILPGAATAAPQPAPKPIPPGAMEPNDDRLIRSTGEHPFYVYGKGWTPLCELKPGDWIRTDNGWVEVSGVEDTGKWETVYNCRVADYHTYFVGAPHWGFAVWAHNACYDPKSNTSIQKLLQGTGQLAGLRRNPNLRGVAIEALLKKTPAQLEQMVKDGDLTSKILKQIKKAFEGRDLRHGN